MSADADSRAEGALAAWQPEYGVGNCHISRELKKYNDLPNSHFVLLCSLAKVISHSRNDMTNTVSIVSVCEPDGRAVITPISNMDD
ncbi:unnamed protein product [Dibothriocephalus latus]|uniref:Uncharacterized protein n=1 Tax=Dibothriocephalus latus TaxID=60516 RepID=A0A3P6SFB7_DIBLA|nr:unnamed protein product [Dibothriocephalus latus]